jgi:hypothetical protein
MISFLVVLTQSVIIVLNPLHVVALNLNPHVVTRMVHGTGIGIVVVAVAVAAVVVAIDPVVYFLGVAHHVANLT